MRIDISVAEFFTEKSRWWYSKTQIVLIVCVDANVTKFIRQVVWGLHHHIVRIESPYSRVHRDVRLRDDLRCSRSSRFSGSEYPFMTSLALSKRF